MDSRIWLLQLLGWKMDVKLIDTTAGTQLLCRDCACKRPGARRLRSVTQPSDTARAPHQEGWYGGKQEGDGRQSEQEDSNAGQPHDRVGCAGSCWCRHSQLRSQRELALVARPSGLPAYKPGTAVLRAGCLRIKGHTETSVSHERSARRPCRPARQAGLRAGLPYRAHAAGRGLQQGDCLCSQS